MSRFVYCFIFSLSLFAQEELPKVDEQLDVHLVELDVKVVSIGGNFIRGLGPSDIEIHENGTLQTIDQMEEVRLRNLKEPEEVAYRSRTMLLIDFMNTNSEDLFPSFSRFEDFFRNQYDLQSEIGIAINNGSIQEVVSFTSNREKLLNGIQEAAALFKKSRYKGFYKTRLLSREFSSPSQRNDNGLNNNHAQSDSFSTYIANEQNKLGQFVRYMSAFSGKKNLIMVKSAWDVANSPPMRDSGYKSGQISIRDIQTACLFNKITLSLISMQPVRNLASEEIDPNVAFAEQLSIDWGEAMALATAGSIARASYTNLATLLSQEVERGETYYRVRYYSSTKSDKYRKLSVKAKGLGRIASSFAGYYPKKEPIQVLANEQTIQQLGPMKFHLRLPSEWLHWEGAGLAKQRTNYTLSYRILSAEGQLLAEKVRAGELLRKRSDKVTPWIETEFALKLPPLNGQGKIEVRLLDMNTGEIMLMEKAI